MEVIEGNAEHSVPCLEVNSDIEGLGGVPGNVRVRKRLVGDAEHKRSV